MVLVDDVVLILTLLHTLGAGEELGMGVSNAGVSS